MRSVITFITILTALCIASGCSKVEEKRPIKISINVWPGYAHAFIAQKKGFFKNNNVDVELVLKEDISEAKELFERGEVDGLFNVFTDIIMINSQGIWTKVVYIADYSDTGDVIIGGPQFNSLADLKGKRVSFEGINSFSHMFVLRALDEVGIREYDVQFENIHAMDVLSALEERRIDAGHTWEPITTQALERGYKILAKAGDIPGIIIDVLAFREKVIRERPDEIQAIVKSVLEARDFIYSNRKEALEIMSESEGIPMKELEEGVRGVHFPDLEETTQAMKKSEQAASLHNSGEIILDFFVKRGQLSERLDLGKIIEPRFLINVQGENK